jgi:glycosyltransferase involved in cell wall biosynthesis
MLERCLANLQLLDYPNYEVVVIDNGSSDPKVAQVIARSGFRHAREDRPGLDWARNRGIKEAKFNIVSYIDDDAIAWPGWLRGIARGFVDPSVMAVTGLVLPSELDTEAQNLFEWYGGMGKGFSPRTFNRTTLRSRALFAAHHCGVGANMAFRRALFDKVGSFDTALDVGTPSGGAGDLDMFHRVIAAGLTIRYEPHAVIWHTHRRSLTALRRQIYANGRSYGVYLTKCFKRGSGGRSSAFSYTLTWFFGWVIKRVFSRKLRKDGFPSALRRAELYGALHAPWAYMATMRNDRRVRDSCALRGGRE